MACTLTATLSAPVQMTAALAAPESLSAALSIPLRYEPTTYTGAYEYTPTQDTQTIPVSGLLAAQDITINPIPSNYGLITWNGSTLTVS